MDGRRDGRMDERKGARSVDWSHVNSEARNDAGAVPALQRHLDVDGRLDLAGVLDVRDTYGVRHAPTELEAALCILQGKETLHLVRLLGLVLLKQADAALYPERLLARPSRHLHRVQQGPLPQLGPRDPLQRVDHVGVSAADLDLVPLVVLLAPGIQRGGRRRSPCHHVPLKRDHIVLAQEVASLCELDDGVGDQRPVALGHALRDVQLALAHAERERRRRSPVPECEILRAGVVGDAPLLATDVDPRRRGMDRIVEADFGTVRCVEFCRHGRRDLSRRAVVRLFNARDGRHPDNSDGGILTMIVQTTAR
mmetsp:Transcript_60/g.163  ORF Transcript_60/g.163 Transcript_60/m.163 type:complete len:310 (+) Transcript_60:1359-2288(+)